MAATPSRSARSSASIARATVVLSACRHHAIGLLVTLTIAIILFYASTDKAALTSMTFVYLTLMIIPLIAAFMYTLNVTPFGGSSASSASNLVFYGFAGATILVYVMVYLYAKYSTSATHFFVKMVIYVGIAAALFVALLIFRAVAMDRLRAIQDTKYGIFARIILYIPCVLSDFASYIVGEYRITSSQIIALFVAEIIIIAMIFCAIKIYQKQVEINLINKYYARIEELHEMGYTVEAAKKIAEVELGFKRPDIEYQSLIED